MSLEHLLAELEAKAKRAGELKALLAVLNNTDPFKAGRSVAFFDEKTMTDVMPKDLLREVIALGVQEMEKQTEDELTALLEK